MWIAAWTAIMAACALLQKAQKTEEYAENGKKR